MGMAALFLGLLVALFLGLNVTGNRTALTTQVVVPSGSASGSPEAAFITEPFQVGGVGNLEVRVSTSVDNSWLYLDGALINEDTAALDEFELETSYYHGYDPEDGQWTEGSRKASTYLGRIPAGRYRLRLAPQWEAGNVPGPYQVDVKRQVPRFYQFALAAFLVLLWPLLLFVRFWSFEAARWSHSDHPGGHPLG
jgi:hypothetical protein